MSTTYGATARIVVRIEAAHTRTDDIGMATDAVDLQYSTSLADGDSDNQANLLYLNPLTLPQEEEELITLFEDSGFALLDGFVQGRNFIAIEAVVA